MKDFTCYYCEARHTVDCPATLFLGTGTLEDLVCGATLPTDCKSERKSLDITKLIKCRAGAKYPHFYEGHHLGYMFESLMLMTIEEEPL